MDPPAFSFVTGSCAFINEAKYDRPGKPYGGGYEIFESMAADDPDMMLWLGDNIYLREVDFQSYRDFSTGTATPGKHQKWPICSRHVPIMPFGMTMIWTQRQRWQLGACRLVAQIVPDVLEQSKLWLA